MNLPNVRLFEDITNKAPQGRSTNKQSSVRSDIISNEAIFALIYSDSACENTTSSGLFFGFSLSSAFCVSLCTP